MQLNYIYYTYPETASYFHFDAYPLRSSITCINTYMHIRTMN